MNDFSKASKLFFTILFADDISVFLEGKEYTKLVEILNEKLNKITIWLNANKLMINVKKTQYMVFHRAKIKTLGTDVIMQNTSIQCVKSTQFLGVIMDDHITNVKNKISKFLGILYKIRRYLDNTTLTNMYYSFVFPYLIYCVEIWGSSLKSYLDPLVKIQKKCIRTISLSEYLAPSEQLFQKLNILNFEKLVIQRISLMMFKRSIGVFPLPVSALFQYNSVIHTHNTRRS